MSAAPRRIVVGISGASGAVYGARMIEVLAGVDGVETHAVISRGARRTMAFETGRDPDAILAQADFHHDDAEVGAVIASGSFRTEGMVVAPCSVKTLSAIAHSYADNLLVRAADVCLKERRRLVLMFRETPLHAGHLRLMTEATEAGAVLLPPVPAFYRRPCSVAELVDHSVSRALDLVGVELDIAPRWGGLPASPTAEAGE